MERQRQGQKEHSLEHMGLDCTGLFLQASIIPQTDLFEPFITLTGL